MNGLAADLTLHIPFQITSGVFFMPTEDIFVDIAMTEEQALDLLAHIGDPQRATDLLKPVFAQIKDEIEGSLDYKAHHITGTITRIKSH
jgi:hypothetical protein